MRQSEDVRESAVHRRRHGAARAALSGLDKNPAPELAISTVEGLQRSTMGYPAAKALGWAQFSACTARKVVEGANLNLR